MNNITLFNNNTNLQEIFETISSLPLAKEEQEKTMSVQASSDTSITVEPDDNKTLSKVTVNIDVDLKEEQEKTIDTQAHTDTTLTIEPDEGKTLSKVIVNIDVKDEQEKTIIINSNGTQTVLPDTGKTLSKVTVTTEIEGGSNTEDFLDYKCSKKSYTNSSITTVPSYAFAGCFSLAAIDMPACTVLKQYAFAECSSLTSIDLPSCTTVSSFAFQYCQSLQSANLPVCTTIGGSAFINCRSLTSIDLPSCITIDYAVFSYCTSLQSVNLPVCGSVNNYVFLSCSSLTSINLPRLGSLAYGLFQSCYALSSIDLPACVNTSNSAFYNCSSLTSVSLPNCATIGTGTFQSCKMLPSIDLPICNSIGASAFMSCSSLTALTLRASRVATLAGANAFQSTPMSVSTYTGSFGSIYVPASLVDAYKSATNWITYKDRIAAITEFGKIDDIVVLLNGGVVCDIPLLGFKAAPENLIIVPRDDTLLEISNTQVTASNIVFDISSLTDTESETELTVTCNYNGKVYTKSFKVILTQPIRTFSVNIHVNQTLNVVVPWLGYTAATNLSIIADDENRLSISNIQSTADNIAFDLTAYDSVGEVNLAITYDYANKTYTKNAIVQINNLPTYEFEVLDQAPYTFVLNDQGYYESNNKGIDSSYAMCKINIYSPERYTMYVDCINYAESSYDFGMLSKLDNILAYNNSEDSAGSLQESFKGKQMSSVQTVIYEIPEGEHFIYIKFKKDQSVSSNYDSLQFKIRFM